MLTRPIHRITLSSQIADELQRLLLSGEFPVGSALPSEAELGRTFQCSRGAIREALRSLEQMGILRRAPNGRELFVCALEPEKVSESFQMYVHLSQATYGEFFEVLEGMEAWVAASAAANREAHALERMAELHERTAITSGDLLEVEQGFHTLLGEATGNRLLVVILKPVRTILDEVIRGMAPKLGTTAMSGTARAHTEILDAIKSGDEARASDWAYRHASAFRRNLSLLNRAEGDAIRPLAQDDISHS